MDDEATSCSICGKIELKRSVCLECQMTLQLRKVS